MSEYAKYFSGEVLYGDDFTPAEIEKWYREEEEAYIDVLEDDYYYQYHNLNRLHGFKYVRDAAEFTNVLGIGGADGIEFLPIISRVRALTIVEPSKSLWVDKIGHLRPNYLQPQVDGSLRFPDGTFDLITCFGTLHHVPNVGHVLAELIRVLEPSGKLLIREPIRTMGDWRQPRKGLTKNERGIPPAYFDARFEEHGLRVVAKSFCESLFACRWPRKLLGTLSDSYSFQMYDKAVSWLFQRNYYYHPRSPFQKLAPGSVFYVVEKPEARGVAEKRAA